MSDLSINSVSNGAVSPLKAVSQSEANAASGAGAKASLRPDTSVDVSNYVTSPKGVVDPESGVFVLQYRDGSTGEVMKQYPSEKVVAAYKRGAAGGDGAGASAQPATTATQQGGAGVEGGATVEGAAVAAPVAPTSVGTTSVGTVSTAGQGSSTSTSVDV